MSAARVTPLAAWIAGQVGVPAGALTPAALEAFQLRRLRETVAWACARSALYRARLAPGGRVPALDGLADLARLPFTTADDVRARGAALACVPQDEIARVVTLPTSGTTGAPKRLRFTADEQESILDFFRHGMSTLVGPGDRVLVLLPGAAPGGVAALLAEALRRLGATPVPHGLLSELPAALDVVRAARPTSLVGAPVQALALARFAAEAGEPLRLRTALLTADHVPDALARELARAAGCEVFEHYGMTEMGLGGAVDCAAHAGYHLREPDLLFEVVDPATLRPVAEGEPGEVVFTTLSRSGMPLVRYRTGDLARLLTGPCPCGAWLRRLERVRGRLEEREASRALLGAGGLSTPALDEALFAVPGLVDYAAALRGGPGRARLAVTAFAFGAELGPLARAAGEALARVPAVAAARAAGRLEVAVAAAALGPRLPRGPAKRALAIEAGDLSSLSQDGRGPR